MLGAIIGDILGSVYEWHNIKTKDFPLFRDDSSFADDDEPLFLEHNDPFTNDEIQVLKVFENQNMQKFGEINRAMSDLQQKN